jgi:threonine 3-dehydrogenase
MRETKLSDVQKELGMTEGFDVGLEMSGNRGGVPRHARQHEPRRQRSPCWASRSEEMAIDWRTVIFNMLTIKGIYGREMYETWYKMTVMLQSGLDITPVITHRLPLHRV